MSHEKGSEDEVFWKGRNAFKLPIEELPSMSDIVAINEKMKNVCVDQRLRLPVYPRPVSHVLVPNVTLSDGLWISSFIHGGLGVRD